jgi:glycogen(starch) synthase
MPQSIALMLPLISRRSTQRGSLSECGGVVGNACVDMALNILIYSPAFYPSIGGLEAMAEMLADGFNKAGHEVKVVTTTRGDGEEPFSFEVLRCPRPLTLLALVRRADVFFQVNISLKGLWPWLLVRKLLVASHNGWYCSENHCDWRARLKHRVSQWAINISVSQAVAAHVPALSTVIPNAYRDDIFKLYPDIKRERDLIFIGRLVSDKGCNVLVEALTPLGHHGLRPALTIVGGGPEEESLREQVQTLGLGEQVQFAGVQRGVDLAKSLNAHKVMVVPSLWEEPFGIVALEGIACGCAVVGTQGGGLPEAIGPCGMTVPRGDSQTLAEAIKILLSDPALQARYREKAPEHLARHTRARVVQTYLEVLEKAAAGRPAP